MEQGPLVAYAASTNCCFYNIFTQQVRFVVCVQKLMFDTSRVATDFKWNRIQIDILKVNLGPPKSFVPCYVFFSGPIASDAP
jgi:hypothetical protein